LPSKSRSRAKSKPDRGQHQGCQHEAAEALAGQGGAAFNAYVIPAGKTKHGPNPNWGKDEWAMAAIAGIFANTLPRHAYHSKLTRDVNDRLALDPNYRAIYGKDTISRQVVIRALKKLREANR
jgi:hypothetical protein